DQASFDRDLPQRLHSGSQHSGAPDKIRTCDLWLRRPTLYPAELRVRAVGSTPRARWKQALRLRCDMAIDYVLAMGCEPHKQLGVERLVGLHRTRILARTALAQVRADRDQR